MCAQMHNLDSIQRDFSQDATEYHTQGTRDLRRKLKLFFLTKLIGHRRDNAQACVSSVNVIPTINVIPTVNVILINRKCNTNQP